MTSNLEWLSLDNGRHESKEMTDSGLFRRFPSGTGRARTTNLDVELSDDDYIVTIKGEDWWFGPITKTESEDGDSNFLQTKCVIDTRIAMYAALDHFFEDGQHVGLNFGLPISLYGNAKEKQTLRTEILLGTHEFAVNGKSKTIYVDAVQFMPECAAATILLPQRHRIAHGIDAGGATTNFATWENGKWIDRLSGTLPFGLLNSNLSLDGYARKVAIAITKLIHEFRGPIYTMGGKAEDLAIALKHYIRHVEITSLEDGVLANVKAYTELGRRQRDRVLQGQKGPSTQR